MWAVIVAAVACWLVVCFVAFRLFVAPRARRARIDRLSALQRPLIPVPSMLATTHEVASLGERLGALWSLEAKGQAGAEKVRNLYVPAVPGTPSNASLDDVIRSFQDPRLGTALAGGEQLLWNAMDMALPNAFEIMAGHAFTGFVAAGKDALLEDAPNILEHFVHGGHHGAVDALNAAFHSAFDAGIHGAGKDVLHHITEAFDPDAASGAHFPWISFLFSAQRELRLLSEDRTNIDRSIEHLALDTAGVWVGAKAGAAVGAAFGPLGALGGAILGAITGKSVTNDIKQAPLRRAQQAYDVEAQALTKDAAASFEELHETISERVQDARSQLEELAASRPHIGSDAVRKRIQREVTAVIAAAEGSLRAYRAELEDAYQSRINQIPRDSAHHLLLGTAVARSLREDSAQQHALVDGQLFGIESHLRRVQLEAEPFTALNQVLRLSLPMTPVLREALMHLAAELELVGLDLANALGRWAAVVSRDYRGALARICEVVTRESRRHEQLVSSRINRLRPLRDALLRERDALGLSTK